MLLIVSLSSLGLSACSAEAAQPTILVEGTQEWGARPDQSVDWRLEQRAGEENVIYFVADEGGGGGTRRLGSDDPLWASAVIPTVDAPTLVFGGVSDDVDRVVVETAQGDELVPDLVTVEGRDWRVFIDELPRQWATAGSNSVEIVAYADGTEVERSPLGS